MPVTIRNVPRDYAWGSTTLLAELRGERPTGQPEAEVWFGDHPASPSQLAEGGSLADITEVPLPFLLKLLAAASPLSIQVHPTKEQATAAYAAEAGRADGNYSDGNHKPELIVALSPQFRALCGLADATSSASVFELLPSNDGVEEVLSRLRADALGDVIAWALSPAASESVADVCTALAEVPAVDVAPAPGVQDAEARVHMLKAVAEQYPGDGGVIVAGLMNYIVLETGEGLFLDAGILHAYLGGLGVEIMAASDNVLRGGLTPKRIDVPELLRIAHAAPSEVSILPPGGEYPVPVPDFTLSRVTITPRADASLGSITSPTIVLVTAASVTVTSATGAASAQVGEAVYLAAGEGEAVISSEASATVFVASTTLA